MFVEKFDFSLKTDDHEFVTSGNIFHCLKTVVGDWKFLTESENDRCIFMGTEHLGVHFVKGTGICFESLRDDLWSFIRELYDPTPHSYNCDCSDCWIDLD